MSELISTIENLHHLSIFKIILLHQSYASAWIYSDQSCNLYGEQMSAFLMQEFQLLPKLFYDLNYFRERNSANCDRIKYYFSKNQLNIIFVAQHSQVNQLHCAIRMDSVLISTEDVMSEIVLAMKKSKHVSTKILFITKTKLSYFKRSKNQFLLESTPIYSNKSMIADFIQRFFQFSIESIKSVNMHQSDLIIFFQLMVPLGCLAYFNRKYLFYGPNGFVTEQIGRLLNATTIIQTDVGIQYPEFEDWYTKSLYSRYYYLLNHHQEIATNSIVSKFNQSISEYADLFMSSYPVKLDGNSNSTEFLYPHQIDCLRIVVPRITKEQQFLVKLIQNYKCQSICILFIMMVMFRIIFGRSRIRQWLPDLLSTLGIFLAQNRITKSHTKWMSIWNLDLVLISLFSTTALSAICYKTLVSVIFEPQIDSLNDLVESNLTIIISKLLITDIEAWGSNLDPRIAEKFEFQADIWTSMKSNSNVAFALEETMAHYHISVLKDAVPEGEMLPLRIMKEPLYCGLTSYRISIRNPIKRTVNKIIQGLVENGLRNKHLQWTQRYFDAIRFKIKQKDGMAPTINNQALSVSKIFGAMLLYVGGVCTSLIVILLELIWKKYTLNG